MIKVKENQQVPFIKEEPSVNEEARPEIASEGVNAIETEGVIPMPIEIEVKKAPLKKKKAPGARESENNRIAKINKNSKTKKDDDKKNGVVKVKKVKAVVVNVAVIPVKRKAGRPKMTHKQKFIAKIIRVGKKNGEVISAAQADVIYYKIKEAGRIKSESEFYFLVRDVKRMQDGVCKKMIILMAVIPTIRGKLGMPNNVTLYKTRSVAMHEVQLLNVSGLFSPVFAGLALWDTRNTALDTAISNNEKKDGSGSATIVAGKKADVKKSLDLFMIYINALALANQAQAVLIIETALCVVCKTPVKVSKEIRFKMGPGTGKITIIAKGAGRGISATYEFQYGYLVAGVIVWTDAGSQPKCKIILTGMLTGVNTYFRKRMTTTKGGTSDWCASISTSVL